MRLQLLVVALALAGAAGIAGAERVITPPSEDFPLEGARPGMTLALWQTLAPPASAGAVPAATCKEDIESVPVPGVPLSAKARPTDVTVCAYTDQYGDKVLPHSVWIDDYFQADTLSFVFVRGRLAEVRFAASVDAYDAVVAQLVRRFGSSSELRREPIAAAAGPTERIIRTWRAAGAEAVLTSPAPDDPTKLSGRLDFARPPDLGQAD